MQLALRFLLLLALDPTLELKLKPLHREVCIYVITGLLDELITRRVSGPDNKPILDVGGDVVVGESLDDLAPEIQGALCYNSGWPPAPSPVHMAWRISSHRGPSSVAYLEKARGEERKGKERKGKERSVLSA